MKQIKELISIERKEIEKIQSRTEVVKSLAIQAIFSIRENFDQSRARNENLVEGFLRACDVDSHIPTPIVFLDRDAYVQYTHESKKIFSEVKQTALTAINMQTTIDNGLLIHVKRDISDVKRIFQAYLEFEINNISKHLNSIYNLQKKVVPEKIEKISA